VEISGTVYCKFHLGDTSVKARLQGAKVELYESYLLNNPFKIIKNI